jgi:molecular chaperone DnaK
MGEVREMLAKKDSHTTQAIREAVTSFQQSSLKLFEVAYKKMAEKNSPSGGGGGSQQSTEADQQQQQSEEQKKEEQK